LTYRSKEMSITEARPTVTRLVACAIDRAESFESLGAAKASKRDLTHYVMEIATETEFGMHHSEWYSDSVIAGALFAIWTEGTPNV